MILPSCIQGACLILTSFVLLLVFLILHFFSYIFIVFYGFVYDFTKALLTVIANQVIIEGDKLGILSLAVVAVVLLPN